MHRVNRDRAAFALARPVRPRRLKSPPGLPRMNASIRLLGNDYGNCGRIVVMKARKRKGIGLFLFDFLRRQGYKGTGGFSVDDGMERAARQQGGF